MFWKSYQKSYLKSYLKSDLNFPIFNSCEEISLQYNNRGHLYYKLVEFELAVSDYTTAIQFNDKLAVAFYNRGTIHYRMSEFSFIQIIK